MVDSKAKPLPSQETLQELFSYSKESGDLRWRARPLIHFNSENEWRRWNKRYSGTIAGTVGRPKAPRRIVHIQSVDYPAHRIIWKLVTGEEPIEIDHKDRNCCNNVWSNLRPATHAENCRNRIRTKKSDLPTGVRPAGNRFYACITVNGDRRYLGLFDTEMQAAAAYKNAALKLHGEFAAHG